MQIIVLPCKGRSYRCIVRVVPPIILTGRSGRSHCITKVIIYQIVTPKLVARGPVIGNLTGRWWVNPKAIPIIPIHISIRLFIWKSITIKVDHVPHAIIVPVTKIFTIIPHTVSITIIPELCRILTPNTITIQVFKWLGVIAKPQVLITSR